MQERRTTERTRLKGWVELTLAGHSPRRAEAADLCVDGIGVRIDGAPFSPGARLATEFPLPGIGLPLELSAEVVWTHEGRVGLRFQDVDPGLRELVESFVSGRLAD